MTTVGLGPFYPFLHVWAVLYGGLTHFRPSARSLSSSGLEDRAQSLIIGIGLDEEGAQQ